MKIKVLELFSGTHSIGKECHKRDYEVYSLDRDLPNYDKLDKDKKYKSFKHFQEDILTWDYKQYPTGYFHLITASPVCLYWSSLRYTWIGRKMKNKDTGKLNEKAFTREDLQNDIDNYGKPMVDKIFEIIDYFKPKNFWIENPNSSTMKKYITHLPFVIVDYCKYSNFGYKKRTRFWVNQTIKDKFKPKLCKRDCENIIIIPGKKDQKLHKNRMGTSKTINDNGKIVRVNTAVLREKYKDYPNIQINHKSVLANGYEIDKDGKKILVNTKERRKWYREYKKKYKKEIASHKKKVSKLHKISMGSWGKKGTTQTGIGSGSNRLQRYRIPPKLINGLLDCMEF